MSENQLSEQQLDELWRFFAENRDEETRNVLLIQYVPLVRTIVLRMMPTYNAYNEFDDLVSCGVMGLMDAIEKFDLSQGVRFKTYAALRIRGEIIDHMRRSDWAPSSLRRKITSINNAIEKLEFEHGRAVEESEVAEHLGMTEGEVTEALEKSYIFNIMHFEDMLTDTWTAIPSDENDESPSMYMEGQEMKRILAELIEELSEKERTVVSLYYYEEMTLKEISRVLGVTESRVSQIHSRILMKMRGRLKQVLEE